jgi:TolA-binding protein
VIAAYRAAQRDGTELSDRALLVVAQAAAGLDDAELAIAVVRDMMDRHPRSSLLPRALWDTAQVQSRARRDDLARKTLEHLVARYPDDPFARQAEQRLHERVS